jgi:hypothetical protein
MAETIDYGNLMHQAMRGLIKTVLIQVQSDGLPGEHHFFITFDTRHPGVEIAQWLMDRYPAEMTVVMQHWFDDLEVGEDGFGVTLSFGNSPEHLFIPYDALETFVDPSVEFGLRFETSEEEDGTVQEAPMAEDVEPEPHAPGDAEVVSLDKFRK